MNLRRRRPASVTHGGGNPAVTYSTGSAVFDRGNRIRVRDRERIRASWTAKPPLWRAIVRSTNRERDAVRLDAITAAYPTLPLGAEVTVTNRDAGKKIEVEVNYRRPEDCWRLDIGGRITSQGRRRGLKDLRDAVDLSTRAATASVSSPASTSISPAASIRAMDASSSQPYLPRNESRSGFGIVTRTAMPASCRLGRRRGGTCPTRWRPSWRWHAAPWRRCRRGGHG